MAIGAGADADARARRQTHRNLRRAMRDEIPPPGLEPGTPDASKSRRVTVLTHLVFCVDDHALPGRLELPTLRLTASRSNQLSYGSLAFLLKLV